MAFYLRKLNHLLEQKTSNIESVNKERGWRKYLSDSHIYHIFRNPIMCKNNLAYVQPVAHY